MQGLNCLLHAGLESLFDVGLEDRINGVQRLESTPTLSENLSLMPLPLDVV